MKGGVVKFFIMGYNGREFCELYKMVGISNVLVLFVGGESFVVSMLNLFVIV